MVQDPFLWDFVSFSSPSLSYGDVSVEKSFKVYWILLGLTLQRKCLHLLFVSIGAAQLQSTSRQQPDTCANVSGVCEGILLGLSRTS